MLISDYLCFMLGLRCGDLECLNTTKVTILVYFCTRSCALKTTHDTLHTYLHTAHYTLSLNLLNYTLPSVAENLIPHRLVHTALHL